MFIFRIVLAIFLVAQIIAFRQWNPKTFCHKKLQASLNKRTYPERKDKKPTEHSELEVVQQKIAELEAKLAKAEADGLAIDNPGVVALNNKITSLNINLAELRKEKNFLRVESSAGKSLFILFIYIAN
jgi:hypothetical protein